MSPAMASVLELGRLTLKRLGCLPDALVNRHVDLSRFPSLANLIVVGPQVKLAAIAHAISRSNITPHACIESIILILFFDGANWYDEDGRIGKLDARLSEVGALTKVDITCQPRNVGDPHRLRLAFPKLDAKGILKVTGGS